MILDWAGLLLVLDSTIAFVYRVTLTVAGLIGGAQLFKMALGSDSFCWRLGIGPY
jgi:hypothetical protein